MAYSSAPHLHSLPWTSSMNLSSLSVTNPNSTHWLFSNRTNRISHPLSVSVSVSVSHSSSCADQSDVETKKNTRSALRELYEGQVPNHVRHRAEEVGYVVPTPVQSEALPVFFSGRDCVIHAQTGSGKTLAYLLLILSVVNPQRSSVLALIVVPTRELGMQVTKVARMLAAKSPELVSEQKSCTVMALLDGGTLRRHKSWLKALTQAIHPAPPASYDQQRKIKGTGVFIPRSMNRGKQNAKQGRFMASSNKFQKPCDQNSRGFLHMAYSNNMINSSYDHSFNIRRLLFQEM